MESKITKVHWTKTAFPYFCFDCMERWWSFKSFFKQCKFCGSENFTGGGG